MHGNVVSISDGDTIAVLVDNKQHKIRLIGIDAPELGQDFSKKARNALASLCLNKEVEVISKGKDKYGRILGDVFVGDTNVNRDLVRQGLTWHYKQFSDDKTLAGLEIEAKKAKRGLWSQPHPVPPWEWRRWGAAERRKWQRERPSKQGHVTGNEPENDTRQKESPTVRYWLSANSHVRHNASCRWFEKTKNGRYCEKDEGKPCGQCGG